MLSHTKMNLNIYNVVGIEYMQSQQKTSDRLASK